MKESLSGNLRPFVRSIRQIVSIWKASALKEIPPLANANSAEWSLWKSAFADHYANRMYLWLRVHFQNGNWFYNLSKEHNDRNIYLPIDLEEVQKAQRKYVHLRNLRFGYGNNRTASSLDEIRSILKFLRPSLGPSTCLSLHVIKAPKEAIAELLSPFNSAPFRGIDLISYEEAFEDFLRKQIELDSLQKFGVYSKSPPALELEAEFKSNQSAKSFSGLLLSLRE